MSTGDLRAYGLAKLGVELPGLLDRAKAAGLAWLEIELIDDGRIVAVWPSAEPLLADPAEVADGPIDRLGWHDYAPELRSELKGLTARFPPDAVADAAARLAELIAIHGPSRPRQDQQ